MIEILPYNLEFNQTIRTSRGSMNSHQIRILRVIWNGKVGYGEAAPLPGLSRDQVQDIDQWYIKYLQDEGPAINDSCFEHLPSLQFAFESATMLWDDQAPNQIPINGLVWMDHPENMLKEAIIKAEEGYEVIKFKVGAFDLDAECRMLESFRKKFSSFKKVIRLDANGAYSPDDVKKILKEFIRFDVHSIEQPMKPEFDEMMAELVSETSFSIALDESLISPQLHKFNYLKRVGCPMLVLKPTLLGGFKETSAWIKAAESVNTKWWITSALESQIGLGAIANFISPLNPQFAQGLGTGKIYRNNFMAEWEAEQGYLKKKNEPVNFHDIWKNLKKANPNYPHEVTV